MILASFSDRFKYFHTADMFAALVHASICLHHVIVRYKLFVFFAYYFATLSQIISVTEHSVHPYENGSYWGIYLLKSGNRNYESL